MYTTIYNPQAVLDKQSLNKQKKGQSILYTIVFNFTSIKNGYTRIMNNRLMASSK
jgi:hypothetical protein